MPQLILYQDFQAFEIADLTPESGWLAIPREITAGPHAGKWALPLNIVHVPQLEDIQLQLSGGTVTAVDVALAWPQEE